MSSVTLERKLNALAESITNSELIQKSRTIAKTKGKMFSNNHYRFLRDQLSIDSQVYGNGDHTLTITNNRRDVFKAKGRIEHLEGSVPNPIVWIGARQYEVTTYTIGDWQSTIEDIYEEK